MSEKRRRDGRYLVYGGSSVPYVYGPLSWPIGGVYARGYDQAAKVASELFGPGPVRVRRYTLPTGWIEDEDGPFHTLTTEYGKRYACRLCGRYTRGEEPAHRRHHPECPFFSLPAPAPRPVDTP